jgi:ABC-type branched-subunit amino acid transport system ATPase component/ABC-type branched-subunit amino acid transport system permease subunit
MTMGPKTWWVRSIRSSWKQDVLLPGIVFVLFVAALGLVEDRYLIHLVALVIFWACLATTWNWIGGYAGQLSLGHAAFVGLGAYLGYALEKEFGIPPWYALIAAVPVGAAAAVAIGAPTLRLTGVFFSLATVVFPFTLQILFTYWGYQEALIPPKPDSPTLYMQWADPRAYAILFAFMLLLFWFATVALERSHWRYYLAAVRNDQIAAASVGINTWRVKLVTFVASGSAACVLGVVYAQMLFVLTPDTVFGINVSLQSMVLCLVGGLGRIYGPLLGTLMVVPMTQALEARFEAFPGVPQLVYGIMLIAVILVIPNGVVARWQGSGLGRWFAKWPLSGKVAEKTAMALDGGTESRVESVSNLRPRTLDDEVLAVDTVRKAYGGVVAVNNVSFKVSKGEFLGIVGPNGAGKTTLFDLLTGFQRPISGQIRLGSIVTSELPPYRLSRMGLRRTFQVPRPFLSLSVYENVLMGAMSVRDRMTGSVENSARQALSAIGLSDRADSPAGLLTPSQVRLLEVARALAGHPEMLLLDEPLAGLDPSETKELIEILRTLHRSGLTIIMVDHAIATVSQVVERMIVLDNGCLIADGRPEEVTCLPSVVEAYLGTRWQDA